MIEPIPDEELEYVTLHEGIDVNSFSCRSKPEEIDLEEFLKEDALRCQNSFFSVTRVVFWRGTLVGYFRGHPITLQIIMAHARWINPRNECS